MACRAASSTRARAHRIRPALFAGAVWLLFGTSSCLYRRPWTDDAPTAAPPTSVPAFPDGPALRVLVLGDFGTGGEGQREVARAIAETHASNPPDLVLTVGDNFYPRGVASAEDPLWNTVFEDVYDGDFWENLVFFPSLGNHDAEGNERAQFEYSSPGGRWVMPGNYYTFRRAMPSGDTVRFLALDTNILNRGGIRADAQLEWMEPILEGSSDRWVIAYGHHPMVSGGWHGASERVRSFLSPHFQGRVSLYLSGHNHSTELLRMPEGIFQGVCGGGAGRDNAYRVGETPLTVSAFSNGGWCLLHIWRDTLAIEGYNRVGTLRFRHLIPRPGTGKLDAAPRGPGRLAPLPDGNTVSRR